jgi:hypothetical protein
MRSIWNIHYSRWVIDDGQPELDVEQDFDWFALAFWPTQGPLLSTSERVKSAVPTADYKYTVTAEVVFRSEGSCVIDFGLKAIAHPECIASKCKQGDYIKGELALSLPLCTEVAPEEISKTLARKWQVNEIHADVTPYISHPDNPKFFFRDESRIQYEPVLSTASVNARGYVLHCTELA